ncbi:hypothetical protein MACH17_22420 [Phaeobacter inhibens]|nr:hypothetical protein MACH17_22420 [Phaeobacter inhibens]
MRVLFVGVLVSLAVSFLSGSVIGLSEGISRVHKYGTREACERLRFPIFECSQYGDPQ